MNYFIVKLLNLNSNNLTIRQFNQSSNTTILTILTMYNKITFLFVVLFSVFMLTSCGDKKEKTKEFTEDNLGFIDASLTEDEGLLGEKPEYSSTQPGSNEIEDRAFQDAPPMIPHTVDGFFPITKDNNMCNTCHMPEAAEAVGAVPMPVSHFQNWRPDVVEEDGLYKVENNEDFHNETLESLNNAYFSCSQCHVPLSNVEIHIENLFTPEFKDELDKKKSTLGESIGDGI